MTDPKIANYTSLAHEQDYWLNVIAPKYFDFTTTNMYRAGIFGYINEVMATAEEDTYNAITIARREFYPTSALYSKSLYKMAALQKIDLPLATAAVVPAILLVQETDIIEKGTFDGTTYTFTLDNTMNILAGNINFMLDFPVVIIAKKNGNQYSYTTHYDITISNSLNTSTNKYIKNKLIRQAGQNILLLDVVLRQVSLKTYEETITKNATVDVVTLDYKFDGQLANFEIFYKEDGSTSTIQLEKVLLNSLVPSNPFCMYSLVDDYTLRLHFPSNIYFTPRFNSLLTVNIYTTLGSGGNFDTFSGSFVCNMQSDIFTYNNNCLITGLTTGASYGGRDMPSLNDFKRQVVEAYSTNKTICTASDLQIFFDQKAGDSKNKVLFFKKRDDVFERLYGAYVLFKDERENVVPTNTLNTTMTESDFDEYYITTNRLILKPGHIFKYTQNSETSVDIIKNLDLSQNLDSYDDNDEFLFVNPFLISITRSPNALGYYMNSVSRTIAMEYSTANDRSIIQFLISNLHIKRNAILGENFYTISMVITPSADAEELDPFFVADPRPDIELIENQIRAADNGYVKSILYEDINEGCVIATLAYDDNTAEKIRISSRVVKSGEKFEYVPGWKMTCDIGERFKAGDVIATKKVTDTGIIRAIAIAKKVFDDDQLYIPFTIEEYDEENYRYTLRAYISTDDYLSVNGYLRLTSGVVDIHGNTVESALINFENTVFDVSVFVNYHDINYDHKYTDYDYVKTHTLTNTYTPNSQTVFDLVKPIVFIRSPFALTESIPGDSNSEILYTIKEIPLIKANWIRKRGNASYILNAINTNYDFIEEAYDTLENNFSIDMKFFNTYGVSRFYRVGIKNELENLDKVNCSFHFGVRLDTLAPVDIFRDKFVKYVKNYIESLNDVASEGKSIYLMNMISDIKTAFAEISYLEYYGMNNYDYRIQKIEALSDKEISELGYLSYIPEFINIATKVVDDIEVPQIIVSILE